MLEEADSNAREAMVVGSLIQGPSKSMLQGELCTEPFGAGLMGIQIVIFLAISERMNSGHHIILEQSANPNSHYSHNLLPVTIYGEVALPKIRPADSPHRRGEEGR